MSDKERNNSEFEFTHDPEQNKTIFVRELESATADDLSPVPARKKKRKKKILGKIVYLFIVLICVATLIWSTYTLIISFGGYAKGNDLYSDLSDYFNTEDPADISALAGKMTVRSTPAGKASPASLSMSEIRSMKLDNIEINVNEDDGESAQFKAKLEWLKQINPDIYGWITIEGSEVDYPIVRGEDNNYYLDHAYTGEYMIVGSIFADYRTNDKIINNYNTVLYGHNMENGSMFHIVELMTEDEALFNESRILVYTMDGIYEYAPISVYETNAYDQYFRMRFKNTTEFTDFAYDILEKSVYPRTAEFTEYDRILTLSTCTNEEFSGRFALHARLIDVEEFK
ncbi:MAG: class B sortase [Clostridia bacterium]|nr:class B sortase [Clostridia bacterium]